MGDSKAVINKVTIFNAMASRPRWIAFLFFVLYAAVLRQPYYFPIFALKSPKTAFFLSVHIKYVVRILQPDLKFKIHTTHERTI
jgi:hypothetical protein